MSSEQPNTHFLNNNNIAIIQKEIFCRVKSILFDSFNSGNDSHECLYLDGKIQIENLFAGVVSNSFHILPGRSVEELCNLHIC